MLAPEEEKLLEETYKIEKENNEMLHALHSSMMWGRVFRIFYWVVLLLAFIGSYYYAQPYIAKVMDMYNAVSKLLPALK